MSSTPTRSALVTGGSRSIGLAIAEALGRDGYGLTLVARQPGPLRETAERLRAAGLAVVDVAGNLTDSGTMREAVAQHRAAYGAMDVLVNNAGTGVIGRVEDLTDKQLDMLLGVNLRAYVIGYREAAPLLREAVQERRSALVVNVASSTAYRPQRDLAVYTTTKTAVVGLTKAMNLELGAEGIKSTALCPGLVATDMTAISEPDMDRSEMLSTDDVASAVRWLASTSPTCVVPELPLTRPGDIT